MSGSALVAVTWMQCAVREERLRSVLYDLSRAVNNAEAAKDSAQTLLLSKCFHNLLRFAVEP